MPTIDRVTSSTSITTPRFVIHASNNKMANPVARFPSTMTLCTVKFEESNKAGNLSGLEHAMSVPTFGLN